MNLYLKIALKFGILLIFVIFSVFSVFSSDIFFDAKINSKKTLSSNIFLEDNNLNWTYIKYESNNDLSEYKIKSFCDNKSKFVGKKDNDYYFKIKILNKCSNNFIFLTNGNKQIKKSIIKLNIFDNSKLFDYFTDNNQNNLQEINIFINKQIKNIQKNINNLNGFPKIIEKRKLKELIYEKKFLDKILENRNKQYLVPVRNYKISNKKNKIPNAGRPYRSSYTDGIHHGWDVMAPLSTPVISLDYGKIVKIVRDFKFSDLDKVKRSGKLTYEDKLINLDILRGNQVWLKTSKGDVVFYSHLQNIPNNLQLGDIIDRGTKLGEIGISGVPDRHYKDYHLHFPIMKNPYLRKKIGKYSLVDYMKWDWYFKGKSLNYVLENQNDVFKK